MALRLIIVDDNTHFLDAAQGLLDCEGMSVVGVATTSTDALCLAAEMCPDVVLVDIDLGQESGFDLARSLMESELHDGRRVILTSAYPEEDFAELIETEVRAFVPVDAPALRRTDEALRQPNVRCRYFEDVGRAREEIAGCGHDEQHAGNRNRTDPRGRACRAQQRPGRRDGERSERGNGGDHGHVDGEPVRVGHRDRNGEPECGFVVR